MGETSTVESLPPVMIGAAVGTVFGIWRIVEPTPGAIEMSLQENDELDQRDRRRLRAMLEYLAGEPAGLAVAPWWSGPGF